jgi:16S rRNA processing protein RimM
MAVIDRQQGEIGRVTGMFSTPAHDILEIEGSAGEILVPAIEPFLVELDRDNGRLHVDLPQGLIPGTDDVSP